MKWTCAILAVAALGMGCTNNNKKAGEQSAALTPAVTEIAPAPAAATNQPVTYDAPAAQTAAATGAGAKYQVKKGDTLWKIATAHYGNGNQWQKIVSANPGLSPETLKAGQNIVIP